jgi:hypothetical protein
VLPLRNSITPGSIAARPVAAEQRGRDDHVAAVIEGN